MKPSKNAMFDYALALIVVIIGFPIAFIGMTGIWSLSLMTYSLAVSNLLFIFGIQCDLYRNEKNV